VIHPKVYRIRQLNDELRTEGSCRNGRVVAAGRLAQEIEKIGKVAAAVATHDDWNEGDDPYSEHDFGKLDVEGEAVIWKIGYYSLDEMHGSEHPEDPNVTIRILTLMFAEDY
jgi:hypothetical protein